MNETALEQSYSGPMIERQPSDLCFPNRGIPDLKWVNRSLPIQEVSEALGLPAGPGSMIRCWHPERHKNADRTPSVGIQKSRNRVRCFGCGSKSLSVIDFVVDVQSTSVSGAVRWLREHFDLKYIAKGRHLKDSHSVRPYMVGHDQPIDLLVKSGLWASLKPPTQRIVPVLLAFAERGEKSGTFRVKLSYRAIQRFSGVRSFESISRALRQLTEMGWLSTVTQATGDSAVVRDVNTYLLTPSSDAVMELANETAAETRTAVDQERQLRRQQRQQRRTATSMIESDVTSDSLQRAEHALLKSTSLYAECSVGQNSATRIVAANVSPRLPGVLTTVKIHRREPSGIDVVHLLAEIGTRFGDAWRFPSNRSHKSVGRPLGLGRRARLLHHPRRSEEQITGPSLSRVFVASTAIEC